MSTIRKTVTLTDQQNQWVKTQISAGRFTNDSEYIRDLVRRDQEQQARLLALQQAVREGIDSGTFEGDPFEVARATIRENGPE